MTSEFNICHCLAEMMIRNRVQNTERGRLCMKRFSFRLEPVLKERRRREDKLTCELAEARRSLDDALSVLRELEARNATLFDLIRKGQERDLDIDKIMRMTSYVKYLEIAKEEQKERIKELFDKMERKQEELLLAMKARKAVERLKEHKFEEFLREEQLTDQMLIDELATLRYSRG